MQTITSARPAILRLGDPACGDPAQVGGKAAHLSRLAAEHRVPAGFCLTAAAYRPDHPPEAPLPADLEAEFAAAYEALSRSSGIPDVPVAVRGSATISPACSPRRRWTRTGSSPRSLASTRPS